jgi:aerobic-type carbon monoxide dehydrogenase small subunit (CoxS/CutS family)
MNSMNPIPLTVQAKPICAEFAAFDSDAPLLSVLRDNLGFTGTEFGCVQDLCVARPTAVRSR